MNKIFADVVLHVKEKIEFVQRNVLVDEISSLEGVKSVSNLDKRSHLYLVRYDSIAVASKDILSTTRARGWSASIIGL